MRNQEILEPERRRYSIRKLMFRFDYKNHNISTNALEIGQMEFYLMVN
jgi:hypothetical protein